MEIVTDTITKTNELYDEFEASQLVVKLSVGDLVTISINDEIIKDYMTIYINSHVNISFQDKGERIDLDALTEAELLQRQIDKLEAEKTALEEK